MNALTYEPLRHEVITSSGVTVIVTPLSPHTLALLRERSQQLHPDPDPAPYMLPLPNAAQEGDTYLDKDNPEYQTLLAEALIERSNWLMAALNGLALEFPDGKEALIERFAPHIAKLQELTGVEGDAWELTFRHGIIASALDQTMLLGAAQSALPLSADEVANGTRLFRHYVSGALPGRLAAGRRVGASGVAEKGQDET